MTANQPKKYKKKAKQGTPQPTMTFPGGAAGHCSANQVSMLVDVSNPACRRRSDIIIRRVSALMRVFVFAEEDEKCEVAKKGEVSVARLVAAPCRPVSGEQCGPCGLKKSRPLKACHRG